MIALLGFLLILAVLLSGFFAATELAFFSLSEARVRTLVDAGFRGSDPLARLRAEPGRLLLLVRSFGTGAKSAAAALAGVLGYLAAGLSGLALGAAVAWLFLLYLGEALPMRQAVRHNVRLALLAAPLVYLLLRLAYPGLKVLEWLGGGLPEAPVYAVDSVAESEIRQLAALGEDEGVIESHERQIIERAFRLDETKAWDVMVPRVDIFAWRDSLKLSSISAELATVPYSRVPIYGESIDDITGVLYLRDAYQALVVGQRDVPLRSLAREPLIVPGSIPLSKLLGDFQTRRIHMALVVDEYGGTDGLVTLEDVLEELVGEIVDETDVAEEAITRISRSELVAAGDADLREINHFFNTSLPQLEHRSLNGYLLEELGRVPAEGEKLEREGILIDVLEATETQVLRARLQRVASMADVKSSAPAAEARAAADGPLSEPPAPASEVMGPAHAPRRG
jgi:putative hemolysin